MDQIPNTRAAELERLVSKQRADIDTAQARIAELENAARVHHIAIDAAGTLANVTSEAINVLAAQLEELRGGVNLHTVALEKLIENLGTPAEPAERL